MSGLNQDGPKSWLAWIMGNWPELCLAWFVFGDSCISTGPESCLLGLNRVVLVTSLNRVVTGLNRDWPESCPAWGVGPESCHSWILHIWPESWPAWIVTGLNCDRPELWQAWIVSGLSHPAWIVRLESCRPESNVNLDYPISLRLIWMLVIQDWELFKVQFQEDFRTLGDEMDSWPTSTWTF